MSALAKTVLPEVSLAQAIAGEGLTTRQWATILEKSMRTIQLRKLPSEMQLVKGGLTNVIRFGNLPEVWQQEVLYKMSERRCRVPSDLLTSAASSSWEPRIDRSKMSDYNRSKAMAVREAIGVYEAKITQGCEAQEANFYARQKFQELTRSAKHPDGVVVSDRTVRNWLKQVELAGGHGAAPIEAYAEQKAVAHDGAKLINRLRNTVPDGVDPKVYDFDAFKTAFRAKCLKDGAVAVSSIWREYAMAWASNGEVPGLGRPTRPGAPFPFTKDQCRAFAPSAAARQQAGRGKAHAKFNQFLAAPMLSSAELRLRERIVFDDKRIDMEVLDDDTGNPVTVVGYLAMDEATRQILGYLIREKGAVRQTDVEGLTAFILRACGIAGKSAGYATKLVFERGTVAISPQRQALLEAMFPGQLEIVRTSMIGGRNAPGDFAQEGTGNFMGKGKLESFMRTLDLYLMHLPGQRGNVYRNQPAMLGDLHLSPEKLTQPQYKLKGTLIEEAVLAAQTARGLHFLQSGEIAGAKVASDATGVRGPLLYKSEFEAALQAAIAFYNSERGHRREGYLEIPMVQPDGRLLRITESANDKAARLEHELNVRGMSLQRISPGDCAVLLHKVKSVTVTANGVSTTIAGQKLQFWSEHSAAIALAQRNVSATKEFLALYNPEDPRELYLLHNAVSHLNSVKGTLIDNESPVFFEALPLYQAPEINNPVEMAKHRARVATANGRVNLELSRTIVPFLDAHTEQRERNLEAAEPLRAAVNVLRDATPKPEMEPTEIGDAFQNLSRAEQRTQAAAERAANVTPSVPDLEF